MDRGDLRLGANVDDSEDKVIQLVSSSYQSTGRYEHHTRAVSGKDTPFTRKVCAR